MDLTELGAVAAASLVALGSSVCGLRVVHPPVRAAYEVTFAVLFSMGLAFMVLVGTEIATRRFGYDSNSALMMYFVSAVCLAGVWMSVAISMLCTTYDVLVLDLPLVRIKRRGWTWVMLPPCITHVVSGLLATNLALVGRFVCVG